MRKRLLCFCYAVILLFSSLGITPSTVKAANVLYKDDTCIMEYETISQWDSGYNMNIIISNIGEESIVDWAFELQTSDNINNLWNASYETGDNGYKIYAYDWNKNIDPGATVIIGYTANCSGNEMDVPSINAENVIITTNSMSSDNTNNVYSEQKFEVNYEVVDSWQDASNIKVTIRNLSNEPIHNWGLRFISSDAYENIYNGIETGEGDVHLIKNAGWNQDIPANGTVEFGFTQRYDSIIDIPAEFELVSTEKIVADTDYSIDIIKQSENGDISTVQLVIENLSDKVIEDWSLKLQSNFEILDIWNGEVISQNTNVIELQNASYAQNILPGESCFVGMHITCAEKEINISNCTLTEVEPSAEIQKSENKISEVYFDTYSIAAKENVSCKVWAKTSSEENAELKVYKKDGSDWIYVADLFDSGEMNLHGDEIENDGIYSNSLSLYEANVGIIQYKFSLVCGGIERESVIEEIEVVESISRVEFDKYLSDTENMMNDIQEYMSAITYVYGETVDNLVTYIEEKNSTSGDIISVESINGSAIKVIFVNGLEFYIQFSDKSDMKTMIRGGGSNATGNIPDAIEIATTKSRNILYWAPFDTEWGEADETESIINIVNESAYSEDFDIASDAAADVESLKRIDNYGLVILATHGIGGEWIVTGEKVTSDSQYLKEIANKQVGVYYDYDPSNNSYESYYMVNDKWFLGNVKNSLPDSIIINNSCESSMTDTLWNAFKNLGAKTYYGNSGAITNYYATMKCSYLVNKLVLDKEITGDASEASLDAYYNNGAAFIVRGQGNLTLTNSISNACFESGLRYWVTQGDCRALNKLGNIKPTEGKYMGMISTGIGYTMKGGAITQRVDVPQDATCLYFDWNFLSAEFLEFINSSFDDPFEITIKCTDDKQNEEVIFRKSVNTLADDFGATRTNAGELVCISPSVQINGYNDIWMTDWQSEVVDISKYAGKSITLTFGVTNAADTAYPSAVLLDNVHLDCEYGSSDYYKEVEDSKVISPNSNGKSYILYTEPFADKFGYFQEYLKYMNGYTDESQVETKLIKEEEEFVEYWNNMTPGNGTSTIDNVVILMHGNYYAIIIEDGLDDTNSAYLPGIDPENLTTCVDGKVGTDYHATYIGNLKRQNIKTINLYSCNAGLLDAINVEKEKALSSVTGHSSEKYLIEGNVAQAFLQSQNVDVVTAYDGSVGFNSDNSPRLSYAEGHYVGWLNELATVRKIVPYRYSSTMPAEYIASTLIKDSVNIANKKGIMPNGEVLYSGNIAVYEYFEGYTHEVNSSSGVMFSTIVPLKYEVEVDMEKNTQTRKTNISSVA